MFNRLVKTLRQNGSSIFANKGVIRHISKLRYIALAGVGTGVYTVNHYVEDAKQKLSFISKYLPVFELNENTVDSPTNQISPKPSTVIHTDSPSIVDTIAEAAPIPIPTAAATTAQNQTASFSNISEFNQNSQVKLKERNKGLQERLDRVLDDIVELQKKYQKELARLESDNASLKKEIIMLNETIQAENSSGASDNIERFTLKPLIDQYAMVLDELASIPDSSLNNSDSYSNCLPRIVVVGDQSSGKTSVLELIVKARIFPRGSGEMMTKCPITLNLSEGASNVAYFNDDPNKRMYDTNNLVDLNELRREIERRMAANVNKGETVSAKPISLSMKGPSMPRMVLVDLPGLINTVTRDISADTKQQIEQLTERYINNSNSIILCIQDGSVDVERSLVSDIVGKADPLGQRTIMVLTKLDIAESQQVSSKRIKKLMSGELLNNKAINYFAVISGASNKKNFNIDDIGSYELEFFKRSNLFRDGAIAPEQAGSQAMIQAVSACFWNIIKSSIYAEAAKIRSEALALETEWKHTFGLVRELDRKQLYLRVRNEILDDISLITHHHSSSGGGGESSKISLENALNEKIWSNIIPYVFGVIFWPNFVNSDMIIQKSNNDERRVKQAFVSFKTNIEVSLRKWLDNDNLSVLVSNLAKQVLFEKLAFYFDREKPVDSSNRFYYEATKNIKNYILNKVKNEFDWSKNNLHSLSIILQASLNEEQVDDRLNWETGVALYDTVLSEERFKNEKTLNSLLGPGFWSMWLKWKDRPTKEQAKNKKLYEILKNIYENNSGGVVGSLSSGEMENVQRLLGKDKVSTVVINNLYSAVHREELLKKAMKNAERCRKNFNKSENYNREMLNCHDVTLFFRVHKLIQQTATTLKQQLATSELKRFELFVKLELDQMLTSGSYKELINGESVELAERMIKMSKVNEMVDTFIANLQREEFNLL